MAERDLRDRMEPPGVAMGRVALAVVAVVAVLTIAFVAVGVTYALQVKGSTGAIARSFPAPALETTVEPRATAGRDPGPRPLRERPLAERTGQPGRPSARLADAMRAIVARGPAAYDPLPGASR